jgi:hypothetical protein
LLSLYRPAAEQHPVHTSEGLKANMVDGTDRQRIMGLRGISGLVGLEGLDLVAGIVPDYMHGLLLGNTKYISQRL